MVGSTHQDDDLKELSELMEMGKNKRVPRGRLNGPPELMWRGFRMNGLAGLAGWLDCSM